ncbi:hypothetical protein BU14_0797s0003 [Porphyra umbilicalis]|uniref:Uncharacterized protein n=1 Tax=Porphyra umbilicalis TaxID=2786 RepID=A0A1X6NNX2_PORUM|nr:hypothetical protein BU14_0797s0003 [Porphyra umbilicalis]|eukprot:OSX70311.1 hypothetical protein BU14_0797s0003 [Porphyra umbilicalis]
MAALLFPPSQAAGRHAVEDAWHAEEACDAGAGAWAYTAARGAEGGVALHRRLLPGSLPQHAEGLLLEKNVSSTLVRTQAGWVLTHAHARVLGGGTLHEAAQEHHQGERPHQSDWRQHSMPTPGQSPDAGRAAAAAGAPRLHGRLRGRGREPPGAGADAGAGAQRGRRASPAGGAGPRGLRLVSPLPPAAGGGCHGLQVRALPRAAPAHPGRSGRRVGRGVHAARAHGRGVEQVHGGGGRRAGAPVAQRPALLDHGHAALELAARRGGGVGARHARGARRLARGAARGRGCRAEAGGRRGAAGGGAGGGRPRRVRGGPGGAARHLAQRVPARRQQPAPAGHAVPGRLRGGEAGSLPGRAADGGGDGALPAPRVPAQSRGGGARRARRGRAAGAGGGGRGAGGLRRRRAGDAVARVREHARPGAGGPRAGVPGAPPALPALPRHERAGLVARGGGARGGAHATAAAGRGDGSHGGGLGAGGAGGHAGGRRQQAHAGGAGGQAAGRGAGAGEALAGALWRHHAAGGHAGCRTAGSGQRTGDGAGAQRGRLGARARRGARAGHGAPQPGEHLGPHYRGRGAGARCRGTSRR